MYGCPLDATNGNIRAVQKLSRHSQVEVLMIYDDLRLDAQADISDILGGMAQVIFYIGLF